MPRIRFVDPSGAVRVVDAAAGVSLMEAAVAGGIDGIVAECGGACACATCHVYLEQAWADAIAPRSAIEQAMLELVCGVGETSRLSCQVTVDAGADGMRAFVPPSQRKP